MSISIAARSRNLRLGFALFALIAGLAVIAPAPAAAVITGHVKKACKGDYKRLCPGYKIGSTQLRACMEAKQSDISWGCVQALIDSGEVDKQKVKR